MMPAYTSGLTAQATPNLPEGAVLVTWSSLQSHLFNLLRCHGHKAALNAYKEMRSFKCGKEEVPDALGKVGDQSEAECLHAIYGRVLRSLMQLLGVATRDQTKCIFEHIFSEVCFYWNSPSPMLICIYSTQLPPPPPPTRSPVPSVRYLYAHFVSVGTLSWIPS